jgi:uncharacterized protein with ATP-grasp and redox domains
MQCAACVIDDLRGALQDTVADERQRMDILAEAMAWLGSEFSSEAIPSYFITGVHRLLKERAGLRMPFTVLRARCNDAGMSVACRVSKRLAGIAESVERLRFLCLWAIAGNHLDFRTVGTGYTMSTEDVEAQLDQVVGDGLAVDDVGDLAEALGERPSVLYLCDNVGEIALDRLLIEELRVRGCRVTAAVKGGPITSDAVLADAQTVGLTDIVPVILTGPDTLGLPVWGETSAEISEALRRADLVLSKGQANYYALSEVYKDLRGKVFCLLRTKCQPVAAEFGCPEDDRISAVARLDWGLR